MPKLIPLTYESFKNRSFVPSNNFYFAMRDALIPLVLEELPKAVMSAPIVFIKFNADFIPAMLQGIANNHNLLISEDGKWLANYIPAPYRAYPFQLAKSSDGQEVLCIDEDSGLISDGQDGKPFFNDDESPTEFTQSVLNFLAQIHKNKEQTLKICQLLSRHNLIVPWDIKINTPSGEKNISGVFKVDEEALNNLPINEFNELRISGALPAIYCQLLSQHHLELLVRLADYHQEQITTKPDTGALFGDDDILRFQ